MPLFMAPRARHFFDTTDGTHHGRTTTLAVHTVGEVCSHDILSLYTRSEGYHPNGLEGSPVTTLGALGFGEVFGFFDVEVNIFGGEATVWTSNHDIFFLSIPLLYAH